VHVPKATPFIGAILVALIGSSAARAQLSPSRPSSLPHYDIRADKPAGSIPSASGALSTPGRRADLMSGMAAARSALEMRVPGAMVVRHATLGGPVMVGARGGTLTAAAPGGDPERAVRAFLQDNAALFGVSGADVTALETKSTYTNPAGNLRWVTLVQRVGGVPVFRGELRAAVTPKGELTALAGELAPGLDTRRAVATAALSPADAVRAAAVDVGVDAGTSLPTPIAQDPNGLRWTFARGPFVDDVVVDRVVFPLGPGEAVGAWQVLLVLRNAGYYVVVDDTSGRILFRKNLVADQATTASFGVYPSDSPGPLSPTPALPGSGVQGPAMARSTITLVSELPGFDDLGWIPDGSNVTTGNNVDAGLDIDLTDGIDATGRATGVCAGPSPACRNFVFAYNPPPAGSDPPTGAAFRSGIVSDLFFWANRYHDRLYQLGFTEAARNFQTDNFGRGGVGGDAVRAEAQDASDTSNADFLTPADGAPPRMQMYVFNLPTPDRDGDIDHEIVLHELTHGLSNRLIANAVGLDNQQGAGMGEGWSDFYALSILSDPGDDPNASYAAGAYATYNLGALGTDNYFYGIRRFPYSTQPSVNPLTFADIDDTQLDTTDGLYPETPLHFSAHGANEVHNVGEIWALMLWGARANVIARLGGAAGNDRMLQVVTDGMKLTPASPTFTQARDAILQADCAGFAGADELDLWEGFAARGLGGAAVAPASSATSLVGTVESFDLPLLPQALTIDDSTGNANGAVDPGESIALTVPVKNGFTCTSLASLVGTLSTSTPGVTVVQPTSAYGTVGVGVLAGGSAYQLTVDGSVPCGTTLHFTLSFTAAGGIAFSEPISLLTGEVGTPATYNYTGGAVAIPDNTPAGASAALAVPGSFVVERATVRIGSLTHTYVGDLRIQLIAPDATAVTLMSRIPDGTGTNFNDDIVNTTFDDGAATSIQVQTTAVSNGTFRPATPLGALAGHGGTGTWTLKVVDAAPIDIGSLGAWSLTLAPAVCAPPVPLPTTTTVPTTTSTTSTLPPFVPIAGRKLALADRAGAPSRRKITFASSDPGVSTTGLDPIANGAFFHVFNAAGGTDSACLTLPAGAHWSSPSAGTFVYQDRSLAVGPVRTAVIHDGRQFKVTLKGNGPLPIPYTLDEPVQGAVGVVLRSGSRTFCARFGGRITRDSGTNPPNPGGRGQFNAKNAPAPGSCPVPPATCP
jgi:subtilisin-like proprotein convertase family protein